MTNKLEDKLIIVKGKRTYKEIIYPLYKSNMNFFDEIEIDKTGIKKICNLLSFPFLIIKKSTPGNKIILVDTGGYYLFITHLVSLFLRNKILLRIKGNPFVEKRNSIMIEKKKKNPLGIIYHYIRYLMDLYTYPNVDFYIVVSKWLRSSINSFFGKKLLNDYNSEVIITPIYINNFPTKNDYSLSQEKIKILMATNFKYEKKISPIYDFITNYSSFLQKYNIFIDIVGDGILLEEYKHKLNKDNVKLLGFKKDLWKFYKDYDIYVHFSLLDGYPTTVLEAQAAKLPVIVNNCCGMVEQIENGFNGLVVSLEDGNDVKQKILKLINSEKFRKELGENGVVTVEKNNNVEKIGFNIISTLEKLVKNKIL